MFSRNEFQIQSRSVFARSRQYRRILICCLIMPLLALSTAQAQAAQKPASDGSAELRVLVSELQSELQQARQDLARTQERLDILSQKLGQLHPQPSESRGPGTADSYISGADVAKSPPVQEETTLTGDVAENQKLLHSQIEEQQQTKVESASKFRVKLSGLILMNAFSNRGAVDFTDLPNRAFDTSFPGTIGATLRQSIIGLQVIGPEIGGGRSSAYVNVDFAGGFPQRPFGTTNGIVRLRQAAGRIDWENTSLIVAQESPLVAPLSPTSYATVAEPALSWAGNLWVWTPQAVLERKFRTSDNSYFSVSGGLALPLTEQIPQTSKFTVPTAGELSRRPAFEAVAGWHSKRLGQPVILGLGGYTNDLKFQFGRTVNGWAGTAFWEVPIASFLQWSGEAYRGQAIGGLGGGIWQSVVYDGDPDDPTTSFRPINSIGGWTQLKYKALPKLEFNVAAGQDNVLSYSLRWAPQLEGEYTTVFARNRAGFVNAVYRPKSNLLLSVEYRKLWTYRFTGPGNRADQVNVAAGVSF